MDAAAAATHFGRSAAWTVIARCVWKEYRMLRGFWLGVAALTVAGNLAVRFLSGEGEPEMAYALAWGAAALYAVGAAVTLFAVEREEGTVGFLELLPRHSGLLLAGKVLAAFGSALALAAALIAIGAVMSGWRLPPQGFVGEVAAIGAFSVVEFLVWGVLASLLIAQPLLAAVLAIGAASAATQLAISSSSSVERAFEMGFYHTALVPERWLVVAVVGVLDVVLGLRWLDRRKGRNARRTPAFTGDAAGEGALKVQMLPPMVVALASKLARRLGATPRRQLFARLVWQSWREGCLAMLGAVGLGVFLAVCDTAILSRTWQPWGTAPPPIATLFVIPAMFGALAFRADQHARRYRFLAERAAPPALVWAARQTAWLAPLLALTFVLLLGGWWFVLDAVRRYQENGTFIYWWTGSLTKLADTWAAITAQWVVGHPGRLLNLAMLIACGTLAAYALGQLCSMAIGSTVLAGLAALGLAVLVALAAVAAGVWQLSALWFLGVPAAGALAASLVRCRAWMTERTGARSWLAPAAMLATAVGLVAITLPAVRLMQVRPVAGIGMYTAEPLAAMLERWRAEEQGARMVAVRYEQLAGENPGSPDEWPDREAWFAELVENSQMGRCWFSPVQPIAGRASPMSTLSRFVTGDARRHITAGDLDAALLRLVLVERMAAHALQYQPGGGFHAIGQSRRFRRGPFENTPSSDLWSDWAAASGQSAERLERAVAELIAAEGMFPDAGEMVAATHLEIREVLEGRQTPIFLRSYGKQRPTPSGLERLAVATNQLPWERRRALAVLDRMSEWRLDYAGAASHALTPVGGKPQPFSVIGSMQWLLNEGGVAAGAAAAREFDLFYPESVAAAERRLLAACQSSLLPAIELSYRSPLAMELSGFLADRARRRVNIVRLALVAHRLREGVYPMTLAQLESDMPREMTIDPFTGEPLEYRPLGLDLPLMSNASPAGPTIAAHTPLLWSAGPTYLTLQGDPPEAEADAAGSADGAPASSTTGGESRYGIVYDQREPVRVALLQYGAFTNLPSEDWFILVTLPTEFASEGAGD